jgi:hypothetical protein
MPNKQERSSSTTITQKRNCSGIMLQFGSTKSITTPMKSAVFLPLSVQCHSTEEECSNEYKTSILRELKNNSDTPP